MCSRTIEMLYEWRFSTRTRPSRSNTMPRGARSAQRPLVVVLGHLLELRVLHHLQHPEADRQHGEQHRDRRTCRTVRRLVTPAAIFRDGCRHLNFTRFYRLIASAASGRRACAPRLPVAAQPVETRSRPPPRSRPPASRPRHTAYRSVADRARIQSHEHHRVQHGRAEEHDESRQRLRHDELRADEPARNPTIVFARPPIPITPVESASCSSPATVPVSSPGDRSRRQRHVHDDDEHEVHRQCAAHDEAVPASSAARGRARWPGQSRQLSRAALGPVHAPAVGVSDDQHLFDRREVRPPAAR